MFNIRRIALTALAVTALCAVWHLQSSAQEGSASRPGIVTVFDREKIDASFAKAAAGGGSDLLWSHSSAQGTYDVQTHTRESVKNACKPEGCSHKGYTAVVYVVSGAATLVVGGAAKAASPDRFGGQSIQGGASHRIKQGDVYIVPPDTIHWYKDVQPPFRYVEIPVP